MKASRFTDRRHSSHLAAVVLVLVAVVGLCGNVYAQTPGYWKNHSAPGTKQYDATWDKVGGPGAQFLNTNRTWLEELNTVPQGSAFHILAHQYIAAYLNVSRDNFDALRFSGAPDLSDREARDQVASAEALLKGYKLSSIAQIGGDVIYASAGRDAYISLAEILDAFNNMISDQRELLEATGDGTPRSPGVVRVTWGQLKHGF